jgi:NAD(P)H-hydrate epimerase
MTIGLPDLDGNLLAPAPALLTQLLEGPDAIACGPGLGRTLSALAWPPQLLGHAVCPIVLDADALQPSLTQALLAPRRAPCVLTPHPGEFARLTGLSIPEIDANREALAAEFASTHRVTLVLKGHRTIVTDGQRTFVNSTGNSGMATGGSGDVLTGIVASLLGQGLTPFEAAAIAVHTHGSAGDIAAEQYTPRAMIASDLLKTLPAAWKLLEPPPCRIPLQPDADQTAPR